MPVSEHPMQALAAFLPEGSFELVVDYIHHYILLLPRKENRYWAIIVMHTWEGTIVSALTET